MTSRRVGLLIASAGALALLASVARADTDDLSLARRRLRPAPCSPTPAVAAVTGVNPDAHQVYLGDWVVVSVCQLDQLLKTAEAQQTPITLYVEGLDTLNEPAGVDLEAGTLTFALERNQKNEKLWRPFLYDPLFDSEVGLRISVGLRGERALPRVPGANMTVQLHKVYVDWVIALWLAILFLVMAGVVACALYTDMLREGHSVDGARRPYSLGRTQMAWWFFLIVISYNYIWLVTGDRDTIPPSLLGLMGISAATALAATTISSRNASAGQVPSPSKGWWRDLVADEHGEVALDRLQIVVWTIVLTSVFLMSVIWELTMPEFNATLLALMGISSGTYIGFKLPQKS
jgi:hypothetical protein